MTFEETRKEVDKLAGGLYYDLEAEYNFDSGKEVYSIMIHTGLRLDQYVYAEADSWEKALKKLKGKFNA